MLLCTIKLCFPVISINVNCKHINFSNFTISHHAIHIDDRNTNHIRYQCTVTVLVLILNNSVDGLLNSKTNLFYKFIKS